MSNEDEAKTAAPAKPAPHQLSLTNGAIYLLEGCLQDLSGCTTTDKILKWGKCWRYIRAQNDRLISVPGTDGLVDFEKPILPRPDETMDSQQIRVANVNIAHTEWTLVPKVLALTDKRRDICRDAVKHWIAHKSDAKGRQMAMSDNLIMLLEALGLDDVSSEGEE